MTEGTEKEETLPKIELKETPGTQTKQANDSYFSRNKKVLILISIVGLFAWCPNFYRNNPLEYFFNRRIVDAFDHGVSRIGELVPPGELSKKGPFPYTRVFIPKGKIIEASDIEYLPCSVVGSDPCLRDCCEYPVGRRSKVDIGFGARIRGSALE